MLDLRIVVGSVGLNEDQSVLVNGKRLSTECMRPLDGDLEWTRVRLALDTASGLVFRKELRLDGRLIKSLEGRLSLRWRRRLGTNSW